MFKYRFIDIISGEIFEDTVINSAERLGVSTNAIYQAWANGTLIQKRWKVERIGSEKKTLFPQPLLEEWDKTVVEVRELLKKYPRTEVIRVKRKSHFRKPQQI